MRLYGLLGYPLVHSFSEEWFARKIGEEGICDTEYRNFPLEKHGDIPLFLANPSLRGFNVTAPYKVTVMRYLDEIDPVASMIGAVNCVVYYGGKWKGYNTDWIGFTESLDEFTGGTVPKAMILGSGGAASAAAYALERRGINFIRVSRINRGKGYITYREISRKVMNERLLIVNATPLGTFPDTNAAPPIPYCLLTPGHMLYDMVYNPPLTEFLNNGRHAATSIMNGQRMLEIQAGKSWELFCTAY